MSEKRLGKGVSWSRIVTAGVAGVGIMLTASACPEGGNGVPRTSASPAGTGEPAPEDDNSISCPELTHLRVEPAIGRLLVIEGTEATVRLDLTGSTLSVDQGHDGTVEHVLASNEQATLEFGPQPGVDSLDMTFTYFDTPVPYGYVGLHRVC